MTPEPLSRLLRLRTLRARLALGVALAMLAGMVSFVAAGAAYLVQEEFGEGSGADGAESTTEQESDLREGALTAAAVAAPAGLLAAVLGALWATGVGLRSVEQLVAETTAIGPDRLDRRLSVPEGADELRELVSALNALLDRVEAGTHALARFSSEVSHELRTPLAVMASHLEVGLRRERTEAEWRHTAETVLGETRRLTRITEALLELARAGGSDAAQLEPVDLREVVLGVVEAPELEGRVMFAPPDHAVMVDGDADALSLAVANLLRNATRYVPANALVRITIDDGADGRARVHVDDAGPGFEASEIARLIQPFVRGRGTEDIPGSGLGLSIVDRVALRHGGVLVLGASDLGGARATLDLPRRVVDDHTSKGSNAP